MRAFYLKRILELVTPFLIYGLLVPINNSFAQSRIKLGLPIDCVIGKDCWLVNLVDLDSSAGVKDYKCEAESYNGHKGIDISIRDLKAMQKGVTVIAAASGVVRNVRDGMADHGGADAVSEAIKGRECGNGVAIKHARDWETQYCHLGKGSIIVKSGQPVKKGQKLGLVGYSGQTVFPHVHMTTRFKGRTVDPFLGLSTHSPCNFSNQPLWDDDLILALTYPLMDIFNAGLSGVVPPKKSILAGRHQKKVLSRQAPYLVVWAHMFRVQKGDRVKIQITGPDGDVISSLESIIKKSQARRFLYSGKKRHNLYWAEGVYKGHISIRRPNEDGPEYMVIVNKKIFMR
jgi:murein DD-endopeptidase